MAFSISSTEAPTRSGNTSSPPRPNVNAERRGAGEDVVRPALDVVPAEGVGDGEHVAVEVHGDLRDAGGAGGGGQQRDVVGGGVDVVERRRLAGDPGGEVVGSPAAVGDHREAGRLRHRREVGGEPGVAEREAAAGQLAPAARARRLRSSGIVVTATPPALSTANQHATSHGLFGPRSSTRCPGTRPSSSVEDVRDLVGAGQQLAVGPGVVVGAQAGAVRAVLGHDVVEQRGRAVQPLRIVQLGQVEEELGPLRRRREVVAAEGVDVR